MLVDWGVYFRIYNSGIAICVKSHPLHYNDCASSNSVSPLDKQALILGVTAFVFTNTIAIACRIEQYSNVVCDVWNNPISFLIFFLVLNVFPVLSSVTSDTESLLPFSNVLEFTSPVLFPHTSLVILACLSSVGFWSHMWGDS